MYTACGGDSNVLTGATNLHVDVADAVNCTTWTMIAKHPAAVWHIFPRHSVQQLRQVLNTTHPELHGVDAIQAQSIYLSEHNLAQLALHHNIIPWTIEQHAGDMVFIPAGCPHQVRSERC